MCTDACAESVKLQLVLHINTVQYSVWIQALCLVRLLSHQHRELQASGMDAQIAIMTKYWCTLFAAVMLFPDFTVLLSSHIPVDWCISVLVDSWLH